MNILMDALTDTGKLLPLLAAIYFIVGFMEYRYGHRLRHVISNLGVTGPVVGALLGCVPQCGFSVIASALYVKRLISVGTLLAVFLATSDEAVPVLLAMPDKIGMVGGLIAIKIVVAVLAGLLVDYFIQGRERAKRVSGTAECATICANAHDHSGCCSHELDDKQSGPKALILHPLLHTLKIFLFLFVLTLIFNVAVQVIGYARIASLLLQGSVLQPAVASLIGLIPNCFASVLLAELFAKGAISFGSLVAGLSAGAGLGLLVLIKENKDRRDTVFVIGMLLAISIFVGVIIQCIGCQ